MDILLFFQLRGRAGFCNYKFYLDFLHCPLFRFFDKESRLEDINLKLSINRNSRLRMDSFPSLFINLLTTTSLLNIFVLNNKTNMEHTYINLYCVQCERKSETRDLLNVKSKNGRPMLSGICTECGTTKTQFVKDAKRGDLIGSLNSVTKNIKLPWARFPWEMHLPGHSFTGPGTRLDLRLKPDGVPKTFSKPIDRVASAALRHDLTYAQYPDTASI